MPTIVKKTLPYLFFALFLSGLFLSPTFYALSANAPRTISLIFILSILAIFRPQFNYKLKLNKEFKVEYLLCFLIGGAFYSLGRFWNLPLMQPEMDWRDFVYACLILPIFYEILFRLCLWSVIERMKLYKFLPLILTTFSFTLYYFYPLFWGPHPYKAFIYFQTMMYLIMGLWWGYAFLRERNITHVFLMHIFFQIGYYTADIWKFIGEL